MDPYAAQTYPPPPPSQIQPQNPDPNVYNQSQPYSHYPQQQYPNPTVVYPQHPEQEHAPIHPPGVPVQNDPNQIAAYPHAYGQPPLQNDPYYQQQPQLSYPDAGMAHQAQQQWQPQWPIADYGLTALYPPNVQGGVASTGRGGGRGGFRGRGSSFQGRGRGRGRGGKTTTGEPKPRCMAWCELCRVDCTTLEILENHKNGKKHRKNLKIQEDLQKLAAKTQESQVVAVATPAPPENTIKVPENEEQKNGLKRKTREGPEVVEPSKKAKEIIPFICEMCNVRCESPSTFDSHLKGKKHMFNLERFQEQQASLGQAALQALYPALEALYPALLQAISQNGNASTSTGNASLDQQVLEWLQAYLPQAGPAVLPQGPVSAPGPGFVAQGPTQPGPTKEAPKEPESKIEEKVGPESKTEPVESEPEPEPVPEEPVAVPDSVSEPEPVPVVTVSVPETESVSISEAS